MTDLVVCNHGRLLQRRRPRHDGWTRARRAVFLDMLATTANVTHAAHIAGMDTTSAYRLRRRDPAFAAAWAEASEAGFLRLEDELLARAMGDAADAIVPGESGIEPAGPFDPDLAYKLVQQRAARHKVDRSRVHKTASIEEVEQALRKKLDALARRLARNAPPEGKP